jgi:hypothetical protein
MLGWRFCLGNPDDNEQLAIDGAYPVGDARSHAAMRRAVSIYRKP